MKTLFDISDLSFIRSTERYMKEMRTAGFESVSVSLNCFCRDRNSFSEKAFAGLNTDNKMDGLIRDMYDRYSSAGVGISVLRAPSLSLDTKTSELNNIQHDLAEKTIRLCKEVECEYVIIPPVLAGVSSAEPDEVNTEHYNTLAGIAKESGITILIENNVRNFNGHFVRGFLSDAEKASEFIDELNTNAGADVFGFCLNVGNCSLCGIDMHEFSLKLSNKLKAVVLSDCNGKNNSSLVPFTCVNNGLLTDWKTLINGLREIEFDGQIILNISDSVRAVPLLRNATLEYAKKTTDYLIQQIDFYKRVASYNSVVLFGAGNMFYKFMELYGSRIVPEFVCDNNKSLWGKKLYGIEVRAPEELKRLPDNCTIIISNVFYCSDIACQIREMGIENNIDYFIE